MSRSSAFLLGILASCLLPAFAAAAAVPVLDSDRLTSLTGSSQTFLHIPAAGRYSLSAQSPTGALIQIVDRMAGTITSAKADDAAAGSSGRSARIDAFLEPGDYKVRVAHSPKETVFLAVRRFSTRTGTDESSAPVLTEGGNFSGQLHDLELFSSWVTVDAKSPNLLIEASGRNLKDMVLWKDGVWDTGVRPLSRTMEREQGRPLTVLELNMKLQPGTYLLICAGGPRAAWAQDVDAEPFSIARGARFLGEMGRMSLTLPEQGTTSFIVSGTVDDVEMQAFNALGYRLIVSGFQAGRSRYDGARQAEITEKSASYRCSVRGRSSSQPSWVTLQGPAGQTVEVRWFSDTVSRPGGLLQPFRESGSYLTSVLSSLEGEDSIDATGLILQLARKGNAGTLETPALQTVTISPEQPLRRKVNCLGPLTFILQPGRKETYAIVEKDKDGPSATYLFSLLDDQFFPSEVRPIGVRGGDRIELLEKLYSVTIVPVKSGVLDFAIVAASVPEDAAKDLFNSPPPAPRNDIFLPATSIMQAGSLQSFLVLGQRQGVVQGVVVRKLPVDLSQPVPVRVDPGKTLTFPFSFAADQVLSSTHPGFSPSTVTVDSVPWERGRIIARGIHQCAISNPTQQAQWHVVSAGPQDPSVGNPSPTVVDPQSQFPTLPEGVTTWISYDRGQTASYLLAVREPGSYRVSTAGRLAMGATIRTPLRLSVAEASENADGRNAQLTAYLRPGTYLVQASARGSSTGRAGIRLERVPIVAAGAARDGEILRATVAAGELMQADVQVAADGQYALECLGLGRAFPYRLEDDDGWPVGAPIRQGLLSERLAAGTYHYISLADRERTRRVLSFRAAGAPQGIDPDAKSAVLRLNQTIQKTWNEQPGRPADVFTLALPAEIHGAFSLSAGMNYRIIDPRGTTVYQGIGGKRLPVELPGGSWRIEIVSQQEDNRKKYQITLTTEDLFVGGLRFVSSSYGVLPVTIGTAGTVEISSYGKNELDASLTDESGRMVAEGQTISNDWNFRVLASVPAGRYQLRYSSPLFFPSPPGVVRAQSEGNPKEGAAAPSSGMALPQPLGSESEVRMIVREEKAVAPATGQLAADIDLAQEIAVATFSTKEGGVYRIAAQSPAPASVAVFREGRLLASSASPLFLPLAPRSKYTLRFWLNAEQRWPVGLRAGLLGSVDMTTDGSLRVQAGTLRIVFPAGSSFRLESDAGPLLFASGVETPFHPVGDAAVSTAAGTGWALGADGASLGACRVTSLALEDGSAEGVLLGEGGGSFFLRVPKQNVALVRTENGGKPVGLSAALSAAVSASPSANPRGSRKTAAKVDWSGAAVGPRASLIGLREGTFRGRLWETAPASGGENRRVAVAAEMLRVATETTLGKGGRTLSVPARSAVALRLAQGQRSVEASLEQGMTAFAWTNAPAGFLDASEGSVTGVLSAPGGSIVVMNHGSDAAMCRISDAAPLSSAEVSEGSAWESVNVGDSQLSFTIRPTRSSSRLYLWGSVERARFESEEDGHIYEGEMISAELSPVLSFPAQSGRLDVSAFPGPIRVWISTPDSMRKTFVGRDARIKQSALPAKGGMLQPLAQAWTFSLEASSFVSLQADAGGVMGLFDRSGACLKAAAATTGRNILAMLAPGAYTVYTRPFLNTAASGGLVTVRPISATSIEADGEGPSALLGPHDTALYRFAVTAAGRVGCGIRAGSETAVATLFDSRFVPIDTGKIFIRSLQPGPYYLLITSTQTQRCVPVVFGREGNGAPIPDTIIKSYRGE